MSDNLKQRITDALAFDEYDSAGYVIVALRDFLTLTAKDKCRNHKLEVDRASRARMVGCGECAVCIAKEVTQKQ